MVVVKSVLAASRQKFLGRFTVYAQKQQQQEEEEQVPPYVSSTCHLLLLLPFLFLPIIHLAPACATLLTAHTSPKELFLAA